jgi:hypothetical protein
MIITLNIIIFIASIAMIVLAVRFRDRLKKRAEALDYKEHDVLSKERELLVKKGKLDQFQQELAAKQNQLAKLQADVQQQNEKNKKTSQELNHRVRQMDARELEVTTGKEENQQQKIRLHTLIKQVNEKLEQENEQINTEKSQLIEEKRAVEGQKRKLLEQEKQNIEQAQRIEREMEELLFINKNLKDKKDELEKLELQYTKAIKQLDEDKQLLNAEKDELKAVRNAMTSENLEINRQWDRLKIEKRNVDEARKY